MNMCFEHLYSGLLPCPWPDCQNGTRARSFKANGKIIFRYKFGEHMDLPSYAWIVHEADAAHVAAQLTRRAIVQVNGTPLVQPTDGFLYHFTGEAALRSILSSGELWLTDYRDFIDQGEIRDGLDVAKATFERLAPELSDEANELLRSLIETPLPDAVYVACFSMLQESPYHWTEYAKDASGAAIVIEPFGLAPLTAVDPFAVQLTRVAYIWDVKAGLFAHLAVWLDELIAFDKRRNVFSLQAYLREATQVFGELLPMCKEVSFLREHESRLVVSPSSSRLGVFRGLQPRSFGNRRYVTTRDLLTSFSLPIERVLLGPRFGGDPDTLAIERARIQRVALP